MSAVCAVVVTHNRPQLLRECLEGLLAQTEPCKILVVDNASSQETAELLREFDDQITSIRLEMNSGGAGGFAAGLRRAVQDPAADFFWLLDDDTVPAKSCLEELIKADDRFKRAGATPYFLASKVVWTDGRRHPMNQGMLDERHDFAEIAAESGCVALKAASFVSVLVPRKAVADYGLPIADFFIWGDDVEFTLRVGLHHPGALVPTSIAVHKTVQFKASAPGPRLFYLARNWVWIVRFSPAFAGRRRRAFLRQLIVIVRAVVRGRSGSAVLAGGRGLVAGLTRKPDISEVRAPVPTS